MAIRFAASTLLATLTVVLSAPAHADGPQRSLVDWVGSWTIGVEQTIDISMENDRELVIDGYATYGARDPARIAEGSVQVGAFFARRTMDDIEDGNVIRFAFDGDEALPYENPDRGLCRVVLELKGAKLKVSDNGRCGGANVSFTGLYSAPYKG